MSRNPSRRKAHYGHHTAGVQHRRVCFARRPVHRRRGSYSRLPTFPDGAPQDVSRWPCFRDSRKSARSFANAQCSQGLPTGVAEVREGNDRQARPDVHTIKYRTKRTKNRRSTRRRSFATRLQPQSLVLPGPLPASLGQLFILNHGEDLARAEFTEICSSSRAKNTEVHAPPGHRGGWKGRRPSSLPHRLCIPGRPEQGEYMAAQSAARLYQPLKQTETGPTAKWA